MKRKSDIDYFSQKCFVYPRTIFVVVGKSKVSIINKYFTSPDGSELDVELPISSGSCTWSVRNKESDIFGELIWLRTPTISDLAHEAVHAAMDIFKDTDTIPDVDNQEPLAYLISYITDILYKCLYYKDNKKEDKDSVLLYK